MKKQLGIAFLFLITITLSIPNASAQSLVILSAEKSTYSYGERLELTIEVNEISEELAIIHITDEAGKGSSAIPILIDKLKTQITFPFPFTSEIFPVGKYVIDIEYMDSNDLIEINLINSSNIVIPYWIRDLSIFYVNNQITENEFAKGIELLIKEGIIVIPETSQQEKTDAVRIPEWIKTNTKWWLEGKISDNDFALGLQYLIKIGVIVI